MADWLGLEQVTVGASGRFADDLRSAGERSSSTAYPATPMTPTIEEMGFAEET
jgi:hypothetical protein